MKKTKEWFEEDTSIDFPIQGKLALRDIRIEISVREFLRCEEQRQISYISEGILNGAGAIIRGNHG